MINATSNAAHLSGRSSEWYSPAPIVSAARTVLGSIDIDPASCAQANETVRAVRYYDEQANGLEQTWMGRCFLNPPGGRGLVKAFWSRLVQHWSAGLVTEAIWIGYSLEQLQTLQACEVSPLDFPLCFTSRRISFIAPEGGKRSPTNSNYIAYLPPSPRHDSDVATFEREFSLFGKVRP